MATIHLNKVEFEKRVAKLDGGWKFLGDKPALVDFYASWCRPCQMLMPIIDEVAEEYAGRVDIYKVNVDDEQELAAHFNVRSIPTLAYIPLNDRPTLVPGGMGKAQLKENIETLLLK
jgi:thioredoxin